MIEFYRFQLSNGLRVVHHYNPSTAVIAMDVMYNVGARDEDAHHTGLAHLFEHLMFGGSVNVDDFDKQMELAGGVNNAWTSNDFTNFYSVLPAINAETAFWLESDRMLSLAFNPHSLEVQRQVVVEEFKQNYLGRPYGDIDHLIRSLLYKVHPYRWPTIGLKPAHIETVTPDIVRDFFFKHYGPDNAVLALAGNITPERVRHLAERWFADIPPRDIAPRNLPVEPPFTCQRRLQVNRNVPASAINIAFPMVARGEPGYEEADIITDILASGVSSRFRTLLKKHPELTGADAAISGSEEPGYLTVACRARDNGPDGAARAERIIWDELLNITSDGITDCELRRAINKFESRHTYGLVGMLPIAQSLAMAEMTGCDINTTVPRYKELTVERVNATARAIMRPDNAAVLTVLAKGR